MKIAAVKFPFYVVGTVPNLGRVGHCIHAVDEEAAQDRFRRAHPGVVKFAPWTDTAGRRRPAVELRSTGPME